MDEKRRAPRWKVVLPVRYFGTSSHHEEGVCKTQDVSLSGARLAMVEKHRAGDRLEMIVEIPEDRGSVCLDADVVWQKASSNFEEECKYLTGVVIRRISDCQIKQLLDHAKAQNPRESSSRWREGV